MSNNPNSFVSSRKVFTNLRKYAANGDYRNFSKPEYLKIREPPIREGSKDGLDLGNRQVISRFTGWVTVDEDSKLTRKNAPEVTKQPMTENQKMKFKPSWMEQKFETTQSTEDLLKNKKVRPTTTRSVFEAGVYRHNLDTKLQMANHREDQPGPSTSNFSTRPAGVSTKLFEVTQEAATFLKWETQTNSLGNFNKKQRLQSAVFRDVNIKPYSFHN